MAELLNITEAAKRLGLSIAMASRYARDGRLRAILIGRRRFVTAAEIRRFAVWHVREFGQRRNGGKSKRGAVRAAKRRTT